ncbi:restriction endonuclease subunit S [Sorangium sp. So ce131]|uniref:restriction endonuclease subunit S n=1 Tax=Sorangium sp. So ce131 TaxID=3133282 RepID=UPI003F63EA3F
MSPARWPEVVLGDHVDLLTGFPFKSRQYSSQETDIRLLRGDNIAQGYLRWDGVKRWPRGDAGPYRKFFLEAGDVVVAMDRPWIEAGLKWAAVGEHDGPLLLVQRVARLRGRDGLATRFLRYVIAAPEFVAYVKSITTGVNVPHISGPDIKKYRFHLPPVKIQHHIADVLSAYDELIENNTKRIKVLEEAARSLYHAWFVNHRFPGHERAKLVASAIGDVPEGWPVQPIEGAFEVAGGGTPSKEIDVYWSGGDIHWYTPSDLTGARTMFMDGSGTRITARGLERSSARLFPPWSVMMTSRATIGAVAINTTPACTNQGFITCMPNPRFPLYFLYHWIKENVPVFIRLATGATFKEITKGTFKKIDLVVPPEALVGRFERFAGPIGGQILNLERRNRLLRSTRDLLLPRLLSGEVDVSRLDARCA